MSWLHSSWMGDVQFLAQSAHLFSAISFTLTAYLFGFLGKRFYVACAAFILIKEYWYDVTYEVPTDSWAGSTLDCVVYSFGILVGLWLAWMHRRYKKGLKSCRSCKSVLSPCSSSTGSSS